MKIKNKNKDIQGKGRKKATIVLMGNNNFEIYSLLLKSSATDYCDLLISNFFSRNNLRGSALEVKKENHFRYFQGWIFDPKISISSFPLLKQNDNMSENFYNSFQMGQSPNYPHQRIQNYIQIRINSLEFPVLVHGRLLIFLI